MNAEHGALCSAQVKNSAEERTEWIEKKAGEASKPSQISQPTTGGRASFFTLLFALLNSTLLTKKIILAPTCFEPCAFVNTQQYYCIVLVECVPLDGMLAK